MLDINQILSVSLVLFSMIDILGSVAVISDLKAKTGDIHPLRTTIISGILMVGFLYLGKNILRLFGVDIASFSIAGAFILLLIGIEMITGREIFKYQNSESKSTAVVPLAFPMIAGAGTLTTLISLKAAYDEINILVAIAINLVLVYLVLIYLDLIERIIGKTGSEILKKIFGLIIFAMAIKLLKSNI